ncbi:MAG: glycosyltransferase [archaeon]|nr:MAG: glycosyltransferase [archaeon]
MKVSVIIPTYNSKDTLIKCLNSLIKQNYRSKYEIIVIDDGSTDKTGEAIKKNFKKSKLIRYFSQKNKGPAVARNFGAKKAKGEFILFTDADCVPEKNWIKNITSPFKNKKVVGVSGSYGKNLNKKSIISRLIHFEILERYKKLKKQKEIDFISTYSAAYRRKIFLKTKGFDESFKKPAGEDTELSFKMHKYGKLIFKPEAKVGHFHRSALTKYIKQKSTTGFWRADLYMKHSNKIFRHSFTPLKDYFELALLGLAFLFLIFFLISFNTVLLYVFLGFLIASIACSLRTVLKIKGDPELAILAPFIILIRNFFLGWGAFVGFFKKKRKLNNK